MKKDRTIEIIEQYGKVPPQAVSVEEDLLSILLAYKETLYDVSEVIKADYFYKEANKKIYQAMLDVDFKGEIVDVVTVTRQLLKKGELDEVGGPYYLTQLSSNSKSKVNVVKYAIIVKEQWIKRQIIANSSELTSLAYEDTTDVFELIDKFASYAFDFSMDVANEKYRQVVDVIGEIASRTDKIISGEIKEDGIMSHIKSINDVIYGFKEPDMIVLAGRPGSGKTALMVSLVKGIAEAEIPIGIFSLEMSKQQLTYRLISQSCNLPYNLCIRPKKMSDRELRLFHNGLADINELPIYIDDTAAINIRFLKTKAKEMVVKDGVKIIFIDYLQLMKGISDNRSREAEVSEISRGIKAIAKELKIPIVALAQLSRAVEMRPDKRPRLSDLRESGSIEQDADIVMFMFRPSYYKILEDPTGQYTTEEMKVLTELEVSKHRNGPLETIPLKFNAVTMKFDDFVQQDVSGLPEQLELEVDPF